MALRSLFSVSANNKFYDVRHDDVTLLVTVWDPEQQVEIVGDGLINPMLGSFILSSDSAGQEVVFYGVDYHPYAIFPDDGTFLRNECYGVDLYALVADGAGRTRQGALIEANSESCGFVPQILIDATVVNAICFGGTTGSITVTAAGGDGEPYTYLWNDGITTKDRFGVPAGIYTVTVTDSVGTTASKQIAVGQSPEITLQADKDDDSILLNVSGGVAPYTYLWSDGITDKDRFNLAEGFYEVTITDSQGCTKTFPFHMGSARFFFSGNPVTLDLQARDLELKPNLTFLCEVWLEDEYLSENFKLVASLEHVADRDGTTTFDASVYLRPYLKPHFPEVSQNNVTMATGSFKRFYLKYAEKYGKPATISDFTIADYRYVLLGGLGFEEATRTRFFTDLLAVRRPFFSWLPAASKVDVQQPEYLYLMLHQNNVTGFTVHVRTFIADGTVQELTPFTIAGCQRFEFYCIPVGFRALQLPVDVVKWEVWVTSSTGVELTEQRVYELDWRVARKRRYFLYHNSLGGINTLCTRGEAEIETKVDAETLDRQLLPNYNPALGDTMKTDAVAAPVLNCTTGYIDSPEEYRALADFALSREVRMQEEGRYRAGVVRVKRYKPLSESEYVRALEFDFEMPLERYYTPAI